MANVIQYILDSIAYGSLFALMALGLALLFSVMGLMNFAYGELIMASGYTMYYTQTWGVLPMIVTTLVVATVLSVLMELVAFRPVRRGTAVTLLVTSFAVSPPASCVDSVISTRFQTLDHSGWCPSCSAASATRFMNPQASLKSLKRNPRWIANPSSRCFQAGSVVASAARSASLSRVGMWTLLKLDPAPTSCTDAGHECIVQATPGLQPAARRG